MSSIGSKYAVLRSAVDVDCQTSTTRLPFHDHVLLLVYVTNFYGLLLATTIVCVVIAGACAFFRWLAWGRYMLMIERVSDRAGSADASRDVSRVAREMKGWDPSPAIARIVTGLVNAPGRAASRVASWWRPPRWPPDEDEAI